MINLKLYKSNTLLLIGFFCLIFSANFVINKYFVAQRIAYVNTAVLMEKYKGMEEARRTFQQKSSIWQSNIDTLSKEIENRMKLYEKRHSKMSLGERKLEEELIDAKQREFMKYREAAEHKAKEEEAKLTESVIKQVNAFIESYGESHMYDIILGTASGGAILYGNQDKEITDDILEGLNAAYIPLKSMN